MIQKAVIDKILDFVRQKPRTVQEIAQYIQKNWRTADRYIEVIERETGLVSTRTFREGTRGALKIVFWSAISYAKGSAYQERLLQQIIDGKHKEDFSPFDIYQFVPAEKKRAFIEHTEFSTHPDNRYDKFLAQAKQQLLLFSGNLSWMELGQNMIKTIETLAKNKVSIKVLTRVDVTSLKNTMAALEINQRVGWDAVQVRHCEQPLRAVVVDDYAASFKEVFSPSKIREIKKPTFIFYRISDPEWVGWLQKVFWHLWGQSIDAETRIEALKTIKT